MPVLPDVAEHGALRDIVQNVPCRQMKRNIGSGNLEVVGNYGFLNRGP